MKKYSNNKKQNERQVFDFQVRFQYLECFALANLYSCKHNISFCRNEFTQVQRFPNSKKLKMPSAELASFLCSVFFVKGPFDSGYDEFERKMKGENNRLTHRCTASRDVIPSNARHFARCYVDASYWGSTDLENLEMSANLPQNSKS